MKARDFGTTNQTNDREIWLDKEENDSTFSMQSILPTLLSNLTHHQLSTPYDRTVGLITFEDHVGYSMFSGPRADSVAPLQNKTLEQKHVLRT